jgi:two-component system phosphate regulon sensor histidine kinase PhoR
MLGAAAMLGAPERSLAGGDLFEQLSLAQGGYWPAASVRETLERLIVERAPVEREVTIGARHFILRLSAVTDAGAVLGIVASLSDITKQRELQQTKNDVMALVTHELKTPLTAIQGLSQVLAQFDRIDEPRRREIHLAINEEARRLSAMIDEYLDLTRLEAGARPLGLAPVSVAQWVERVLLLLDPVAAQTEVRLLRRLPPNMPALLADADLLARALTNLVANAIKFSPARGEVIVEARVEGDALRIDVADRGPGIAAESLPRIFEKFYRVPRLEDAETPGTGLGLAFVREIAELHGGRVTVESEIGVGSIFSLRLPLRREETPPQLNSARGDVLPPPFHLAGGGLPPA